MKSSLTSTDLGGRGYSSTSVRSKSLLRKLYLKNLSPKLFCYDDFSTDFIEFPIRRGCYAKSVSSESLLKNGIREFFALNIFIFAFLHQNEGFNNLRNRKFEVNKIRGKSVAERKDGDKWISHVSYQLPVMFSTFSLLGLY